MRHFKQSELACPCCGKCEMDGGFIERLEVSREQADIPFKINSAFRCENQNLKDGGKPDSAHKYGKAVDIKAVDSRSRFIIIRSLLYAGFTRIGIGKTFIHADSDETKDPEVAWLY